MEIKLAIDYETLVKQLEILSNDSFKAHEAVVKVVKDTSEQYGFSSKDVELLMFHACSNDDIRTHLTSIQTPAWVTLHDDDKEKVLSDLKNLFEDFWNNISLIQEMVDDRFVSTYAPQPPTTPQGTSEQEVLTGDIIDAGQSPIERSKFSALPSHANPSWLHQLQQLIAWMTAKLVAWKNHTFEPWAEPRRVRSDKEEVARRNARKGHAPITKHQVAPATTALAIN